MTVPPTSRTTRRRRISLCATRRQSCLITADDFDRHLIRPKMV